MGENTMRFMIVAIGFVTTVVLLQPATAQVVSFMGVEPVQIGMSVQKAEQSLQAKLTPPGPPFSEACWIARRADGKDPSLAYTVQDGKIVRIDVMRSNGSTPKLTEYAGAWHRINRGRYQSRVWPADDLESAIL
jgi:hypothetical protein